MHPECYYSYYAVRYGVYLDNRYEINRSRRRQHSQKEISRQEEGMFVWYKIPQDIHSSGEGYGSHGSQNGRPRHSSGEEEEEEENAETGDKVNAQAPEVSNTASPV